MIEIDLSEKRLDEIPIATAAQIQTFQAEGCRVVVKEPGASAVRYTELFYYGKTNSVLVMRMLEVPGRRAKR